MDPQISFSGRISENSRQSCKNRLWQMFFDMSEGTQMLCHISDRDLECSGTIFVYLPNGMQLASHAVAKDPMGVADALVIGVENQLKEKNKSLVLKSASPGSKILIVDDDPDSVAMMQNILKTMNQPSVFVQDAYDAVGMMVKDEYRLVILDVMMPHLTGPQIVAYADAELDMKPASLKKNKRHYVTFSGETEKAIVSPDCMQFNYMGHWRKQQSYHELMGTVSKTLMNLHPG